MDAAPVVELDPADWLQLRMPLWIAATRGLSIPLGYVIGFAVVDLQDGSLAYSPWPWIIVGTAIAVVITIMNYAFGVTITPHGVATHDTRVRRIAWADVVAITDRSLFGTHSVRVWTLDRRRHRLRAPVTIFGLGRRRFDADLAAIQQAWRQHAPMPG